MLVLGGVGLSALFRAQARHHEQMHVLERRLTRQERRAALGHLAAGVAHEVRNALQAIPPGGAVQVTAVAGAAEVRITTADQGSGIAEEMLERIFDPYFTTKPEGTGLGLPIALQIIQAHGGTLFLDEIGDLPVPLQVNTKGDCFRAFTLSASRVGRHARGPGPPHTPPPYSTGTPQQ